jgi:hypothetical protein
MAIQQAPITVLSLEHDRPPVGLDGLRRDAIAMTGGLLRERGA